MSSTFQFKRGDTFSLVFEIKTNDGGVVNLDEYTARLQLKPSNKNNIVLTALSENNELTIMGDAGFVYLDVDYNKTEHITPGLYRADLELTSAEGIRTSTETFMIRIVEDITV